MNYQIIRLGVVALGLLITTAVVGGVTMAYYGGQGKEQFNLNRDEIRQAVENGDFQAWAVAHYDHPMGLKINQENFFQLVEAHKLMQSGDYEGAWAIKDELGLNEGIRKGWRRGLLKFGGENSVALKAALEGNDYQAWVEAQPEGSPMIMAINQENFSQLVEAHKLMQSGEISQAREIFNNLGLHGKFKNCIKK